ncbi:MAG: sodium:solute symporter family protein [FCB group bacterium]|jgi:SSS family solute:Na+ symporter
MTFSPVDYIVVIVYILIILYTGFILSRRKSSKSSNLEEFLLAGRKLTLPLFVSTLVATWYGNILGVGEFVYTSGLVAWVCFGLPYYFAAGVFAWFIAKKIRNFNVKTIPEQITIKYGPTAGWLSSLIVLIISIPAVYILILGVLVQLFTGWDLWLCIIVATIISMTYLIKGGLKADVFTNTVQFVLMFTGFIVLVIFSMYKFGMPSTLAERLPAQHLQLTGGFSWQIILAWFLIAFTTFIDPSFHQRCSAALTPKTAQKGVLISILFWMLFDSLTLISGLYARAHFSIANPVMAFTVLGENVLPHFWKGLFVVSMIATATAALDSYSFISAATIGNDIFKPFLKAISKDNIFSTKSLIQSGLFVTAIVGITLAILLPSAVQLVYRTASIAVPGLFVPLIISYSKRFYFSNKNIILLMVISVLISCLWLIGRYAFLPIIPKNIFMDIEPMIPGFIFSLIFALFAVRKKIII